MLGENARQKYEQQAGGELGLLIGGRSEILVSFRAIMDSPIIGHGSWAKDYRYVNELIYLKRVLGYSPGQSNELGLIPTHSHLFGAWVEAGILGAVFWIWVLSLPIRGMVMIIGVKENFTPLFVFFGFLLIWHVLFSPFGAELRFIIPYCIVVMMSLLPPRSRRKHFVRW
jgi:O-antigen ligase